MRTEASKPLEGRRLLVGISGSIAAVKSPLLVSRLVKAGAEVRCLVTPSAAKLVSPLAPSTLSRQRCFQSRMNGTPPVPVHCTSNWPSGLS